MFFKSCLCFHILSICLTPISELFTTLGLWARERNWNKWRSVPPYVTDDVSIQVHSLIPRVLHPTSVNVHKQLHNSSSYLAVLAQPLKLAQEHCQELNSAFSRVLLVLQIRQCSNSDTYLSDPDMSHSTMLWHSWRSMDYTLGITQVHTSSVCSAWFPDLGALTARWGISPCFTHFKGCTNMALSNPFYNIKTDWPKLYHESF